MFFRCAGALAVAAGLSTSPVNAQQNPSVPVATAQPIATAPPASPVADANALPSLTPVEIEILATINSSINKIGEHFPIRLVHPVALPGGGEIPAGIIGQGDVVHAAKSRFGGKPGELILAVRYLDWNGIHIPLRSLRYINETGRNNQDLAQSLNLAGSVAPGMSILAMFITGGEVIIPQGTRADAKTSAPVLFPRPNAQTIIQSQEGSPGQ